MLSTSKRPQRGTIFPTSRQLACFHLFSMKPGEPASGDPGKNLAWSKAAAPGERSLRSAPAVTGTPRGVPVITAGRSIAPTAQKQLPGARRILIRSRPQEQAGKSM